MKVLFVSHKHPWPLFEGSRHRLYHLVRALAEEHSVTLLTLLPGVDHSAGMTDFPLASLCARTIQVDSGLEAAPPAFTASPWKRRLRRIRELLTLPQPYILRRWDCPELFTALRELRASEQFDVVWVARSYIAETVRRAGYEKIVVDVDDIESVKYSQRLRLSAWSPAKLIGYVELAKLYAFERSLPRRFWRLVVCKEEDRAFFGPGRDRDQVFVVPNGVADFSPTRPENEIPGQVLFLGSMGYEPNLDAVRFFRSSILPELQRLHPAAQFHVVGNIAGADNLAIRDDKSCHFHGLVPDVTPYFEAATLVVAPIRMGSGTRLKVLEALARRKALVATPMAIEGLNLRPGIDLEVANDGSNFASTCARLLADPVKRLRLADAGRTRVLERFRWEAFGVRARRVLAAPIPAAASPEPGLPIPAIALSSGTSSVRVLARVAP